MAIYGYTKNYKLIKPQFNTDTWHDYIYDNLDTIDAVMSAIYASGNWKGFWATNTAYTSGDVIIDQDTDTMYKVMVDHTTSEATFAEEFTAHPTYYELWSPNDLAEDWAIKMDGEVSNVDYSSKAYAISSALIDSGSAKEWAINSGTIGTTGEYSAKKYATDAHNDYISMTTDANVVAVGTNIANVNTVSSSISNVNTAASNISNINTVAGDISRVGLVADDISSVHTVATDISNVIDVAANKTNIDTVAGDKTNIDKVASDIASVRVTSNYISDVTTVAFDIMNVNTVAGISADVTAVAGVSSYMATVAGLDTEITAVAGNATNINAVAAIDSDVATVASISADVSAVAGNNANVTTVATNISDVNTAATNMPAIQAAPTEANNAATSASNSQVWAEGTDAQVQALGGTHSSKVWAEQAAVSAAGTHFKLFQHNWFDYELDDMAWLRADTFSWQDGTVYTNAYNHLVEDIDGVTASTETVGGYTVTFYRATDGHKIVLADQETTVGNIYTATGVAWYYVLDTANNRFKLPRTKYGFDGLRGNVGDYIVESLPNITGALNNILHNAGSAEGAFTEGTTIAGVTTTGASRSSSNFSFDASNSSPTYQNSAPVQQRGTQMYLYFYVGQYTQSAIEQTAGLNAELFNNKADIDASNFNSAGRSLLSGFGAPSDTYESLTLLASGQTYTAPGNGYIVVNGVSKTTTAYVDLTNRGTTGNQNLNHTFSGFNTAGYWVSGWVPVKNGDVVRFRYDGMQLSGDLYPMSIWYVKAVGEV